MTKGYVIEQFVTAEMIQETVDLYKRVLLTKGEEMSPEGQKELSEYAENPPDPYWLGVKGYKDYTRAKLALSECRRTLPNRHWRIIRAEMPHNDTWLDYTIIPW